MLLVNMVFLIFIPPSHLRQHDMQGMIFFHDSDTQWYVVNLVHLYYLVCGIYYIFLSIQWFLTFLVVGLLLFKLVDISCCPWFMWS
jgi:hypothetical protein